MIGRKSIMMLVFAIITITAAFICYTIGVWGEKLKGSLNLQHLVFFWIGLVFDTTGTTLMSKIANDALSVNFHSITGLLAIALMLVHAVWATIVFRKNDAQQKKSFHKFSILVWCIWMIPFLSGMIVGMMK